MAHFAKLGDGDIVLSVVVVSNDIATSEQAGIDFLHKLYKDRAVWKQTSYNTRFGEHILGGTPFRKNYAGPGFQYDAQRDAFIPPKPYPSWTLNEDTCHWEPPVARPIDDKIYQWDEENKNWVEIIEE